MKKLANLKGVKTLGKAQQKSIFGGEQATDLNGNPIGGGSGVYCGCSGGENQPSSAGYCTWTVCNPLCNHSGNGSFTGVCIS